MQPVADRAAVPRDGQEVEAVVPAHSGLPAGACNEGRARRDHRFYDADGVGVQFLDIERQSPYRLHTGVLQKALDLGGFAFKQEMIVGAQNLIGPRGEPALVLPHMCDDSDPLLATGLQHFLDRLSRQWRCFRHGDFGDVVLDAEHFVLVSGGGISVGNDAPPDQRDVQNAHNGENETDRRKIKHREGLSDRFRAIRGNDDIGRCADHRDEAAEERAERQRHQEAARRTAGPPCHLQHNRQQQSQGADIVHKTGKGRDDGRDQSDLQR